MTYLQLATHFLNLGTLNVLKHIGKNQNINKNNIVLHKINCVYSPWFFVNKLILEFNWNKNRGKILLLN